MARSFIFGFGKASDLTSRTLTVYNISEAPATTVHSNAYAGSAEVSSDVAVGPGRHKAVLVDVRDNGSSRRQTFTFNGNDDWPSMAGDDCQLRILSIEEMSSSSSLSSSSSS